MNEIYSRLAAIIEDVADIPQDEFNEDSSLMMDLDLASLEIMAIIARIEKEFSIKFTEDELLSVETLRDAVEVIFAKKSACI